MRYLVLFILAMLRVPAMEAVSSLRLAVPFTDGAVIQRGKPVPVWGWAQAGAVVQVVMSTQERTATAGPDGRWQVVFAAIEKADRTPMTLRASSLGVQVEAHDVVVGEVWLCAGQSNMELGLWHVTDSKAEIVAASHPDIRVLTVAKISAGAPAADIAGAWKACTPAVAKDVSASAYFMGRELQDRLTVPIGLIVSAWGGAQAEPWLSLPALRREPELVRWAEAFDTAMARYPAAKAIFDRDQSAWNADWDGMLKAPPPAWSAADLDEAAWQSMPVPGSWEGHGLEVDGFVWFRRSIELTPALAGRDLVLSLGPIENGDVCWWDGVRIGDGSGGAPRHYAIHADQAKVGRHSVAVRVFNWGGAGGFTGGPEALHLTATAGGDGLPLAGIWRYRVEHALASRPQMPLGPGHDGLPSGMWNGMVAPLAPCAIRGIAWWQGESNTGRAAAYRALLPTLIADWRRAWGDTGLPFVVVQLANVYGPAKQPEDSDWAELRDAQSAAVRRTPGSALVVGIDIGQADDVHPHNKQEFGRRLALAAMSLAYGATADGSGPLYREAVVESGRMRIRFDHAAGGLAVRGAGGVQQVAISGEDRHFIWAEAVIDGDTLVVSSPVIPHPVAVRYAWARNPAGCNLIGRNNLPAAPFRTDDWPLTTLGK